MKSLLRLAIHGLYDVWFHKSHHSTWRYDLNYMVTKQVDIIWPYDTLSFAMQMGVTYNMFLISPIIIHVAIEEDKMFY